MVRGRVVYLSADGLLSPLGHSQVVRVVEALVDRGFPYAIGSLESKGDLEDTARVRQLRERLAERRIEWLPAIYRPGARGVATNITALTRAALSIRDRTIVHARSYIPATVAHALQRGWGTPYLFDARGYWVDEKLHEGTWFDGRWRLRAARELERSLYERAAAVVHLAETGAQDVREGVFGLVRSGTPVVTIPTLADFARFSLRAQSRPARVLGYIGSINQSYDVEASLRFAAAFLAGDTTRRFHFLTRQTDEAATRVAAAGIADRTIIRSAAPDEMPGELAAIDVGLLLLRDRFSKRGSMPTKLGEMLAAGVAPVASGCNAAFVRWVRRCGSGWVLPQSDADPRAVLDALNAPLDGAVLASARERAAAHFDVESGADRYAELLSSLLGAV